MELEDAYPRIATIINDTVSNVSIMSGPPRALDKKQQTLGYRYERVPGYVRVGMVKQKDGTFEWPPYHSSEPLAVRREREAKNGRAA